MKTVFVNIGTNPDFLQLTLNKALQTNGQPTLISSTPLTNCEWVDINQFNNSDLVVRFKEFSRLDKVSAPQTTYPSQPGFWFNASLRLYYLAEYLKAENVSCWHLENDNILYEPLGPINSKNIWLPRLTSSSFTWGISYIGSPEALVKYCEAGIKFGSYNDMDAPNLCPDIIEELPIIPGHYNFQEFDVLFDAAGYGQHLGGTNNGHPPGFIDENHIIGPNLRRTNLVWDGKKPSVDGIPLVNLHMHNKTVIKDFA